MTMNNITSTPDPVAAFMGGVGVVPIETLSETLGVCQRTIQRWSQMPDGMPVIRVGRHTLFRLDAVREWLLAREVQSNPTRSPRRRNAA